MKRFGCYGNGGMYESSIGRFVLFADVEKLIDALEVLARLGNGGNYGNSDGNIIAIKALEQTRIDSGPQQL